MTELERTIRRDLRRARVPVHLRRRTAERMAAQAYAAAIVGATDALIEADVRRRVERLGGDLQAARAAHNGAAAGEAIALTFLTMGRKISAGIDSLVAHTNRRSA